jgi:hypothetical protein
MTHLLSEGTRRKPLHPGHVHHGFRDEDTSKGPQKLVLQKLDGAEYSISMLPGYIEMKHGPEAKSKSDQTRREQLPGSSAITLTSPSLVLALISRIQRRSGMEGRCGGRRWSSGAVG